MKKIISLVLTLIFILGIGQIGFALEDSLQIQLDRASYQPKDVVKATITGSLTESGESAFYSINGNWQGDIPISGTEINEEIAFSVQSAGMHLLEVSITKSGGQSVTVRRYVSVSDYTLSQISVNNVPFAVMGTDFEDVSVTQTIGENNSSLTVNAPSDSCLNVPYSHSSQGTCRYSVETLSEERGKGLVIENLVGIKNPGLGITWASGSAKGIVMAKFSFYAGDENLGMEASIADSQGNKLTFFSLIRGENGYTIFDLHKANDITTVLGGGDFLPNQWYDVEAIIDISAKETTVKVNGQVVAGNKPISMLNIYKGFNTKATIGEGKKVIYDSIFLGSYHEQPSITGAGFYDKNGDALEVINGLVPEGVQKIEVSFDSLSNIGEVAVLEGNRVLFYPTVSLSNQTAALEISNAKLIAGKYITLAFGPGLTGGTGIATTKTTSYTFLNDGEGAADLYVLLGQKQYQKGSAVTVDILGFLDSDVTYAEYYINGQRKGNVAYSGDIVEDQISFTADTLGSHIFEVRCYDRDYRAYIVKENFQVINTTLTQDRFVDFNDYSVTPAGVFTPSLTGIINATNGYHAEQRPNAKYELETISAQYGKSLTITGIAYPSIILSTSSAISSGRVIYKVSFYIENNESSNGVLPRIWFNTDSSNYILERAKNSDSFFTYFDGTTKLTSAPGTLLPGNWYDLEMIIDLDFDTYSLNINGTNYGTDMALRAKIDSLTGVNFRRSDTTTTSKVAFDNLGFYKVHTDPAITQVTYRDGGGNILTLQNGEVPANIKNITLTFDSAISPQTTVAMGNVAIENSIVSDKTLSFDITYPDQIHSGSYYVIEAAGNQYGFYTQVEDFGVWDSKFLTKGNQVEFLAALQNKSGTAQNAVAVIASYQTVNGALQLVGIKTAQAGMANGQNIGLLTDSLTIASGLTVKAFVWEDLEDGKPISDVFTYTGE